MGRVLLTVDLGYNRETIQSFKCKNEEAAKKIADKRPNVKSYIYYDDCQRIPQTKKKKIEEMPLTFEELELKMKKQGLI